MRAVQLQDQLALLYHKHRVLSRLTGKLAAGIGKHLCLDYLALQ